jgi:hypothetical protein
MTVGLEPGSRLRKGAIYLSHYQALLELRQSRVKWRSMHVFVRRMQEVLSMARVLTANGCTGFGCTKKKKKGALP